MATVQKWSGREARALREALRMSVRGFAAYLGAGERTITKWEARGATIYPLAEMQAMLDTALERAGDEATARFVGALQHKIIEPGSDASEDSELVAYDLPTRAVFDRSEMLRQQVNDVININPDACLDDWEQTVLEHGHATRYRPANALLTDLITDLAELQRVQARFRTSSASRRLIRVTAQMAGLVCLTLIKLDQIGSARNWARTARFAADETGDPAIRSWVRAEEAYGHYYQGNLIGAIGIAGHAQALAGGHYCVGAVLAAALEARASAALGRPVETRQALDHAQSVLSHLPADVTISSAFGYDEAQLRFHEGNAYTHLHDTASAWTAQERALELYPASDYLDRALIQLDRANCLAHDGDTSAAVDYAKQALLSLTPQQRSGLVEVRAQEIVAALPAKEQALPAVRDCRDILMCPTPREQAE